MKTNIISDFTVSDNLVRNTINLYNKLHSYVREPEITKVFDAEQIEMMNTLDSIFKKAVYGIRDEKTGELI